MDVGWRESLDCASLCLLFSRLALPCLASNGHMLSKKIKTHERYYFLVIILGNCLLAWLSACWLACLPTPSFGRIHPRSPCARFHCCCSSYHSIFKLGIIVASCLVQTLTHVRCCCMHNGCRSVFFLCLIFHPRFCLFCVLTGKLNLLRHKNYDG